MLDVSNSRLVRVTLLASASLASFAGVKLSEAGATQALPGIVRTQDSKLEEAIAHAKVELVRITKKISEQPTDISTDILRLDSSLRANDAINNDPVRALKPAKEEVAKLQGILARQVETCNAKDLPVVVENIKVLARVFTSNHEHSFLIHDFFLEQVDVEGWLLSDSEDSELVGQRLDASIEILQAYHLESNHRRAWLDPLFRCHTQGMLKSELEVEQVYKELERAKSILEIAADVRLNSSTEQIEQHTRYVNTLTELVRQVPAESIRAETAFQLFALLDLSEPSVRMRSSFTGDPELDECVEALGKLFHVGLESLSNVSSQQEYVELSTQAIELLRVVKGTSMGLQDVVCEGLTHKVLQASDYKPALLSALVRSATPDTMIDTENKVCPWSSYTFGSMFGKNQEFLETALDDYIDLITSAESQRAKEILIEDYAHVLRFFDRIDSLQWSEIQAARHIYAAYHEESDKRMEASKLAVFRGVFLHGSNRLTELLAQDLVLYSLEDESRYNAQYNWRYCDEIEGIAFLFSKHIPETIDTLCRKTESICETQAADERAGVYRVLRSVAMMEKRHGGDKILDFMFSRIAVESDPHALMELGQSIGSVWHFHSDRILHNVTEGSRLIQFGYEAIDLEKFAHKDAIMFALAPKFSNREMSLSDFLDACVAAELKPQTQMAHLIAAVVGNAESINYLRSAHGSELFISPGELRHRATLVLAGSVMNQVEPEYRHAILGIVDESLKDFGDARQIGERLGVLFEVHLHSPRIADNQNPNYMDEIAAHYRTLVFDGATVREELEGRFHTYRIPSVVDLIIEADQANNSGQRIKTQLGIADAFLRSTSISPLYREARREFLSKVGFSNQEATDPKRILELLSN